MAKNNNTLVFNGLMQGMSWDLIKEAKDEIKRHLGEKQPTRKDILTDWIIGKDYMLQLQGNSYQFGGSYSTWLNRYKEAHPQGSYSWGELSKGKLEDSFSNGNGLNSALGIAGTALDWTTGFIDSVNSIDNSAKLNDAKYIAGQQINFGDNASLMNTLSNLQYADTNTTATDVGGHSFGLSAMNVGKDIFSGATTGLNIAGPLGAAIGGAAGLAKGVIQEIVTNNKAKEAAETANLISGIANDQVNQRMGYASDKSQLLAVLNQLLNMAKNGGKLKKSHKFAEGGLLNTYDYGLEEVNAGGSHEENPNEGVVVSYAPDGLPNKVEEGETIHNDYVYSKRLEANEKVLKNNLLDEKYKGKSFADISKKLTEDRKQRPNDPISVRTNEENLNRLQDAQEELKLDNKTKEVKRFLGSLNNELLNALQQEMMDKYEAYAEQLAQQLEQEALAYQEELAALEGMFSRGGHLYQTRGFMPNVEEQPVDATYYTPFVYDLQARRQALTDRYEAMQAAWNAGLPYYEDATGSLADEFFFGRKLRQINPDGTETIIDNAYLDDNRMPKFILTGEPPVPEGTKGIKSIKGIKGIFSKGKKASKVADKADDALRLMLEAQLGLNITKEIAKEANKKSLKWLRNLGIGVGLTWLPLAGFYVTDIENNKDKYDLKAQERGKNIGDTIIGDWQFKGDTVINTKTGEKIYSKGGHINLYGGKYDLARYEAVKALYDLAYNNRYGDNRVYYNYPKFTNDYIQQLSALDKFNSEDTFRLLYKDLYPYLNTKFTETVAPTSSSLNNLPSAIWSSYETLPKNSVINNVEYNLGYTNPNYNSNLEDPLLKNILSYKPSKSEENEEEEQRNNSNNSNNSNVSTKGTPVKPKSTSTPKSTATSPNNPNYTGLDYMPDSTPVNVELPLGYILDINPNLFGEFNSDEIVDSNSDFIDYSSRPKASPLNSELNGKTTPPPRNPEYKPNYLSYLRYAPILGSLGLVLNDTLGLTNQPDYSNIDMYRRAVDSIGGVNFVPIGGYLQHTPIDREYIANQQLAQAASYNRSLNNVNPVGSYILGLINDAKVRDQIGDMYINAAAQDEKDRLAVAEYNRGIDITNARNSLAAQSENARLRALRANEYQKIATMRDNERNIAEAARAANYDKFITNIGNLGKEEFAFNLVDSNAALLGYYTDRTGRARYRMPAFIKPDGFEAYKQYLKSHGVDESQIDA